MSDTYKVKIIMGSVREGRFNAHATSWISELARARADLSIEVLDLKEYVLPFYEAPISPGQVQNGEYAHPVAREWAKKIGEADAFVIVTPEYNHGTSGVLKNALDAVYAEWNNKPVGFVSYGSTGGARAVAQIRASLPELQAASVRTTPHIMAPWMLTEADGSLKAGALDSYVGAANTMLDQLTLWAKAFKTIRA